MDKQKQLEKIAKLAEVVKTKRLAFNERVFQEDAAREKRDLANAEFNTADFEFRKACAELLEVAPHPTLVGPKPVPVADIPL